MIEYENLEKANRPFFDLFIESFTDTLKKGWFVLGAKVAGFEAEFAAYLGSRHVVGVGSGLDALVLSFDALQLKRGAEVLVASNTYIATIIAILRSGLKPVLVEPDILTYNIDPARMAEKISADTAAILVTHLYGKPCDMGPIMDIAAAHNLKVVEDCAHCIEGERDGIRPGDAF